MRTVRGEKAVVKSAVYLFTFVVDTIACKTGGVSLLDYAFITAFSLSFMWIAFYDSEYHIIQNKSLIFICAVKILWIFLSENPINEAVDTVLTGLVFCVVLIIVGMAASKMNLPIGAGDYKYTAALSFCLGFDKMLLALAIALAAALINYVIAKAGKDEKKLIAAAPFLSFGAGVSPVAFIMLQGFDKYIR